MSTGADQFFTLSERFDPNVAESNMFAQIDLQLNRAMDSGIAQQFPVHQAAIFLI
jgi:hypothetical protein